MPLGASELRSGAIDCIRCSRRFEATAFSPVERKHGHVDVLTATPDGVANACANHARNAAVTNCQRCGLFICALCDMNVGEGSFCPACFDRVRTEGTLKAAVTRYRDYTAMARVALVFGFLLSPAFLGLPFGGIGIYYAIKGMAQRRSEGTSPRGMVVALVIGVLEALSTFVLAALLFIT